MERDRLDADDWFLLVEIARHFHPQAFGPISLYHTPHLRKARAEQRRSALREALAVMRIVRGKNTSGQGSR